MVIRWVFIYIPEDFFIVESGAIITFHTACRGEITITLEDMVEIQIAVFLLDVINVLSYKAAPRTKKDNGMIVVLPTQVKSKENKIIQNVRISTERWASFLFLRSINLHVHEHVESNNNFLS